MSTSIDIISSDAGLISAVVSIVAFILTIWIYVKQRRIIEKQKEVLKHSKIVWDKIPKLENNELRTIFSEEILRVEKNIVNSVVSSASDFDVSSRLKEEIEAFNKRLAKIEEKFPADSKIEKIASINDAIFSERIDYLTKQMEQLENKQLNKWDIALTFSMILGAIATIVTLTYGVLVFFKN